MALPPIIGSTPQTQVAASQARTAAQRAFFDAAMGRALATSAAQPAAQVQARSQAAQASPAPTPKPVARFDPETQPLDTTARPGSIVNIRV